MGGSRSPKSSALQIEIVGALAHIEAGMPVEIPRMRATRRPDFPCIRARPPEIEIARSLSDASQSAQ
jgi:hypothetical protein